MTAWLSRAISILWLDKTVVSLYLHICECMYTYTRVCMYVIGVYTDAIWYTVHFDLMNSKNMQIGGRFSNSNKEKTNQITG